MTRKSRLLLLSLLVLSLGLFALFTPVGPTGFRFIDVLATQEVAPAQFEGKYLYRKAFEAIRDNAYSLQDPATRAKWVAEWEHKHDTDGALATEDGTDKAIHEMLASIKERFDHYSPPAQHQAEQDAFNSTLVGIGTTLYQKGLADAVKTLPEKPTEEQILEAIKITDKTPVIIDEPFEKGPAEKAGIKPGDQIIEVNGKSVNGRQLEEVVSEVKGKSGTTVTIKVRRLDDQGQATEHTFTIVRMAVVVKTAQYKDLGNGISLVKLRGFSSKYTVKEMQEALDKAKNGKALIIDLRGNPGGRLDFVQAISTMLLNEGTMLVTQTRDGDSIIEDRIVLQPKFVLISEEDSANPGSINIQTGDRPALIIPKDMPVVVLVNRGSASASEILAGLLQANHRAIVVGEPTLGKGVGQVVIPLPWNRSIAVTSFKFLPGGKAMDWIGVVPDIEVKRGEDPANDEQLKAAVKAAQELVDNQAALEKKREDLRRANEEMFRKAMEQRSQP